MSKAVDICDQVMYGALLVLVIFVPYSIAMIQVCMFFMMAAWLVKRSLIWKAKPQQGFLSSFALPSISLQWPLLFIGALILMTAPFSHDVALSFKKFLSRFLQQIILMYLVLETVKTPKRFFQVLGVLLLTLLVVNADVFVQYFRGRSFIFFSEMILQRVAGPMRHPNDLGTLLITVIPVVLSLVITRRCWIDLISGQRFSGFLTAISVVVLVLSVIALGLTSSRGAWLAFALTMIVFAVCLRKSWWTGAIILALVLFFLGFGNYCINTRSDISSKETTQVVSDVNSKSSFLNIVHEIEKTFLNYSSRDVYWKSALEVVEKYPFFGCGYNAYIQTLKQLKKGPEFYTHSSLMQITAELGVIGLLAHVWFFFSMFFLGFKILKDVSSQRDLYILGVGLCLGLLAWLLHSFTDTAWQSLQLSMLWWLLIGLLVSFGLIFKQMNLGHKGEK